MRKYIALIFLISILASLPGASYADIDDNINDYNAVIQDVTDIQTTDPNLPTWVAEPKGKVGFIISKLFNSNGRISNRVLKPIATTSRNTSNNKLLRWSGLNGGHFVDSIVYDTGTQVGIWATPTAGSLKLDVAGSIWASQYCDENGLNCFSPSSVALAGATFWGTGTAGHVTRFLGSNTIGDSVIRDNGTNVGIGTTPWANRLTVNGIARIDGGVSVDGRTAITGTNYTHTARATEDTHYWYFEVRNNSNQRWAYFGWGNGWNTVDLYIDNASLLRIRSGQVSLETEWTTATHLVTKWYVDNATSAASPWTVSGANIYRSGGNVGIGTTSPNHKLQVKWAVSIGDTDGHSDNNLILYGSTAGAYSRLFTTNGNLHIDSSVDGWTDAIYLNYYTWWNVNIWNPSKNSDLNVWWSMQWDYLSIRPQNATEWWELRLDGQSWGNSWQLDNVWGGASSRFRIHSGGSEKLTVLGNGNVGIWTTNPSEKLLVSGAGDQRIKIVSTDANSSGLHLRTNGIDWRILNKTTSNDLAITREDIEVFTIRNGGNVGIGTTSPSSWLKLDVEWKVGAIEYCDSDGLNCFTPTSGWAGSSIDDLTDGASDGSSVFLWVNSWNADDGSNNSNTWVWPWSLRDNTSWYDNTAVGRYTLRQNTTWVRNTALWYHAMQANTTGWYNNALWSRALDSNTTGGHNNALWYDSLWVNTTGQRNNAVGSYALDANTTGGQNNALWYHALWANTTGNYNNAIGWYSLDANTTGGGNNALWYSSLTNNTTGDSNNAIWYYSLVENTTGGYNNAIGREALRYNTTGSSNSALGSYSLRYNTTGIRNTWLWYGSMAANTTGSDNTAAGIYSLDANTTGYQNTAIWYDALWVVTSGHNNTALGDNAGDNITSWDYNIIIGSDVDAPSATGNNQINIWNTIYGNRATGSLITTRQWIKGNYSSSQVQWIWSIWDAYNVATSATNNFGNQYGMVYAHTNAGTAAIGWKKPITGKWHQILFTDNGATKASISLSYGDAIFAGDVTSATVATNCVGRGCWGTTLPPASGNWNVTGNLNVSGNLTAANFYNETPIWSTTSRTTNYNQSSTSTSAAWHYMWTSIQIVVPAWPSRKYLILAKNMARRSSASSSTEYSRYTICKSWVTSCMTGINTYDRHMDWGRRTTNATSYVTLPPGTHNYYMYIYRHGSYQAEYAVSTTYTNILAVPLQG